MNASGASDWIETLVTFSRGSCTDAVAAAGACEEFDTGPGGGFVFYDAGSRQPWGQYLEAAPAGWSGTASDPTAQWCADGQPGATTSLSTGTGIGSGAANTKLIIDNCGTDSAAGLAAGYRGGGKSDWFLPSVDESNKVYDRRTEVGGLMPRESYWTSSQNGDNVGDANNQYLVGDYVAGETGYNWKSSKEYVRPIRAF